MIPKVARLDKGRLIERFERRVAIVENPKVSDHMDMAGIRHKAAFDEAIGSLPRPIADK